MKFSYADSSENVERMFWFDYDKQITIDDIPFEDADKFLNEDKKYIEDNKYELEHEDLENQVKELNEELEYLLEKGYIKSYLDENGDFRKINYNFRVYPNDISNYILSLKIAINNRLSLYDIVYDIEEIDKFSYNDVDFLQDDYTFIDRDNLKIKENEKLLYFIVDNLNEDTMVPKNILNSLDIFISPIKENNENLYGLCLTDVWQNNHPRNLIFIGEMSDYIENIKEEKEEETSLRYDKLSEEQKYDLFFNLCSGMTLYHEIGHALMQNYINKTNNFNNIEDIEMMENNLYHELDIDIINDFETIFDLEYTDEYETCIKETFADIYSYYAYYRKGENPDLYDIIIIKYDEEEEINLFFEKYSEKMNSFGELPYLNISINDMDVGYELNRYLNVVDKKFNLKLENKTTNSYTIIFQKVPNLLQLIFGLSGKKTEFVMEPNEVFESELKLSKGNYYVSYIYNDEIEVDYINLAVN